MKKAFRNLSQIMKNFHFDWPMQVKPFPSADEILNNEKWFNEPHGSKVWPFWEIGIDLEKKVIIERENGQIPFGKQKNLFKTLALLAKKPGQKFSRIQIGFAVWGEKYRATQHDELIAKMIHQLRDFLEPVKFLDKYIVNNHDGTYSFNSSVVRRFIKGHPLTRH